MDHRPNGKTQNYKTSGRKQKKIRMIFGLGMSFTCTQDQKQNPQEKNLYKLDLIKKLTVCSMKDTPKRINR